MSKKTLGLIIGLLVVTIILLFVALYTPGTPKQPSGISPTPTKPPHQFTTISFSSDVLNISSQSGSIDIIMDTNTNKVTGVEFDISFDPKSLTNVKVSPGTLFPNPLVFRNTIDQQTGIISYSHVITPAQQPIQGTGSIITISFSRRSSSPSTTTLSFDADTVKVSARGEDRSVLKSTNNTTINWN